MDAIPKISETKSHARSISLPSTSSPLIASIEEQLLRLNSSSEATSSTSIFNKLRGLERLHQSVDDLFHLTQTQQAFSNENNRKCVEQVLDASVNLLDICGITSDVFSQMKECVKELESSLRRNKGSGVILHDIKLYMLQRKRLRKAVCKHLTRIAGKNCNSALLSDKDSNAVTVVQILRQVEETSLRVFESMFSLIPLQSKTRSRLSGFSIFSKILQSQHWIASNDEIEKIDVELLALKSTKDVSVGQVTRALKGLKKFESTMEEAEEELDRVHIQLVNSRVSLLNILDH